MNVTVNVEGSESFEIKITKATSIGSLKKKLADYEIKEFRVNPNQEFSGFDTTQYDKIKMESIWDKLQTPFLSVKAKEGTQEDDEEEEMVDKKKTAHGDKIVRKWLTGIVSEHFPKKRTPKWVNYELFVEEMIKRMEVELREYAKIGLDTIIWYSVALPYTSRYVDIGSSGIMGDLEDNSHMESKIPDVVLKSL